MASYQESQKINDRIKPILDTMVKSDRDMLINAILWMCQTAKYRCRHNTALDNFCRIIFKGCAEIHRVPILINGKEFPILPVRDASDMVDLTEE